MTAIAVSSRCMPMWCMGVDHDFFEEILDDAKAAGGYENDTDLTADDWREVIVSYKAVIEEELDEPFPQDPREQLLGAISAVFSSWMNQRAVIYRSINRIPSDWGTAVSIQAMVFGNMGDEFGHRCGLYPQSVDRRKRALRRVSGQCPGRGCGCRHPHAPGSDRSARLATGSDKPSLEKLMPDAFDELQDIARKLETHYRDDAGRRIHHRARQTVDAADPFRQANGQGCHADRRRHG